MNLLTWIFFGGVVGFIANLLEPQKARGGLLGSVVLGILGSLLGGFLGSLLFGVGVTRFNFPSFIVALAGAFLAMFLDRLLSRKVSQ